MRITALFSLHLVSSATEMYTCQHKGHNHFHLTGTALGGWLVLEPWITPSLFYQFLGKAEVEVTIFTIVSKLLWFRKPKWVWIVRVFVKLLAKKKRIFNCVVIGERGLLMISSQIWLNQVVSYVL